MGLSLREKEVAQLVVGGLSNREIADRLFVTEKTVKFHLTNIYASEGVSSRAQLIVKMLEQDVSSAELGAFKDLLK